MLTTRRREFLLMGAIALVATFAFWNGLENLFKRWGEQQELSHGYFLPVIAAWILWDRRAAIIASASRPAILGIAGVAIAALLLILSELTVTSLMVFQHFGLLLLLASLGLALGGRSVFAITILPIAYLLFMIPPPYWVITVLSWKFQFWSSQLGVFFIQLAGIPVYLSGNVIDLGEYKLAVAEACSGLRYLFPFLSLGFLAAYLFKAPLWQRALVFLSTIPITIFMNSVRIALTAILVQAYGTSHAEGLLHFFEGWVVFVFCLILLFGVIWAFARFSGDKNRSSLLSLPGIEPRSTGGWTQSLFTRNAAISIAILGAAGFVVHFSDNDNLRTPQRADLINLPSEFPDWRAEIRTLEPTILQTLGADDHIVVNMTNEENEFINLYVAYLDMQRDGHSWHSPRQCIPGGGWKITSHDIIPAKRADGREFHFNRIVIENRGVRQLVYYWYDQRGRKIANEFTMKFALLYDAVTQRRTDGAMVRLMTLVAEGEDMAEADARLAAFMSDLEPKLPAFVPLAGAPMEDMASDENH